VLSLVVFVILVGFGSGFGSAGGPAAEGSRTESIRVLVPDWSTFDHQADEWVFTALPVQVGYGTWQVRLRQATVREIRAEFKYDDEYGWKNALVYTDDAREARELDEYLELRHRNLLGKLTAAEQRLLEEKMRRIHARVREKERHEPRSFVIRVPAPPVVPGQPYLLDLTFEAREQDSPNRVTTLVVTTQIWPVVLPSSIPDNSIWLPADLHLHSVYSDGGHHLYAIRDALLANRGYRIAYMTDHVGTHRNEHLHRSACLCPPRGWCPIWFVFVDHDPCRVTNTWSCYVTNTQRVSRPTGISFFPGVELSAAHAGDSEGHALGYGITTFPMNWDGRTVFDLSHAPQQVIDVLNANNSAQPSSAGIAHPTGYYDWPWLGHIRGQNGATFRYRGMELMSGLQVNFGIDSSPVRVWRAETSWLVNQATGRPVFTQGWFPSVRTGSDLDPYNSSKYYTYVLVPVTETQWNDTARTWASRRQLVDRALRDGRTIASWRGSWGRVAINGLLPGSIQRGLAANSMLNMELRLLPSVGGTARVRLYRGNMVETVYSQDIAVTAGTEVTRTFSRTFPGGDQYYWLYVEIVSVGFNDVIYTTPIFLSSTP